MKYIIHKTYLKKIEFKIKERVLSDCHKEDGLMRVIKTRDFNVNYSDMKARILKKKVD